MADNVSITAGAGTVIATEDVGGGRQVQLVKPVWGAADSFTEPDTPTGLPVQFQTPKVQNLTWAVLGSNSCGGDTTLVSAAAANTVRVWALAFTSCSPATVTFKSCQTALSGGMTFGVNGGMVLDKMDDPWFLTTCGGGLLVNVSSDVTINGFLGYTKSS